MIASRTLKHIRPALQHRLVSRNFAKFEVIQTSAPTLFTTSDMDADVQLSRWGQAAKDLFATVPTYIHPQDMDYKLPLDGSPEFAFVGRSNVGKSSLVDLLLGGKKLVKISKEPGCTRSINYYGLSKDGKKSSYVAYLVDLPGYGFAKKSKEDQQKWTEIIHSYVSNRDQCVLRRVFILVDTRRGVRDGDLDMMITLNAACIPYQIVLTKSDLVSTAELYLTVKNTFDLIRSKHGSACLPFVHTLSTVTNSGVDAFKLSMAEVFSHSKAPPSNT